MSEHENRAHIERALLSPLSLIPADLQAAFKSYQLQHYCNRPVSPVLFELM